MFKDSLGSHRMGGSTGGGTVGEHGYVKITLAELISKEGISKNKLSQRAELQRTQINNYCNNKITRLDIDVIARICATLHCEIGDLLEFVPPENSQSGGK